jgi:hypothetical protein
MIFAGSIAKMGTQIGDHGSDDFFLAGSSGIIVKVLGILHATKLLFLILFLFKERRQLAARTYFNACKNPGTLNFPIARPFKMALKPSCF